MRHLVVAVCAVALLAGTTSPALAQSAPPTPIPAPPHYTPTSLVVDADVPRTRDGHPDLQGEVWTANFFTYLQGAPGAQLVVAPERAKAVFEQVFGPMLKNPMFAIELPPDPIPESLPIVRGQYRSRLLVLPADGRMPFTDAARKEMATPMKLPGVNDPEDRSYMERCLFSDEPPPRLNLITLGARQFIQTTDHFVIHTEYGDDAQIVPFAGVGAASPYFGRSSAHWDGDTLVVETTALPGYARRRFLPTLIVNADAKVIERYTRVSKDELLYQFTVEDPKVFTAPWLGEYSFYRAPFRMFPSGCHEGNYALPNILRGGRVAEERAQKLLPEAK